MNKTISIGNMTAEPKITTTSTGKKKAEFTLALNRYKEGADFPRFIAWEKDAERLESWAHKGSKLGVEGHIQTGSYEGKNGKVYTTDIICDRIEFLDKKQAEGQTEGQDEWAHIPDGIQQELPFA